LANYCSSLIVFLVVLHLSWLIVSPVTIYMVFQLQISTNDVVGCCLS
jgi:hypothetical protein